MTDTVVAENKTFIEDFIGFQKAVGPILKDAQNPHFHSNYAKLEDVIEATYEHLHANNLAVMQVVTIKDALDIDPYMTLQTQLIHTSGVSVLSDYILNPKDATNPQQMGSAITYARRYALLSLLGLAPEDDDGNAASNGDTVKVSKPTSGKPVASPTKNASDAQKDYIISLIEQKLAIRDPGEQINWILDEAGIEDLDDLKSAQASSLVEQLKGLESQKKTTKKARANADF